MVTGKCSHNLHDRDDLVDMTSINLFTISYSSGKHYIWLTTLTNAEKYTLYFQYHVWSTRCMVLAVIGFFYYFKYQTSSTYKAQIKLTRTTAFFNYRTDRASLCAWRSTPQGTLVPTTFLQRTIIFHKLYPARYKLDFEGQKLKTNLSLFGFLQKAVK